MIKFLNPLRFLLHPLDLINVFTFKVSGGGGGGPQQSTSTVTQSSIPDWLKPQTEAMLGEATKQIFQTTPGENGSLDITGVKGYKPYSADASSYFANFSPLQQQSFSNVANLQTPWEYSQATNYANAAGQGGIQSAERAGQFGAAGDYAGQVGQSLGVQGGGNYGGMGAGYGAQAAGMAGQGLGYGAIGAGYGAQGAQSATGLGGNVAGQAMGYGSQAAQQGDIYGQMVTNPNAVQSYMSPYQQAVTDVAKAGALRDFQTAQTLRQGNATRAGAFGGGRQAIENAEAQRNLNQQLQNLDVQGQQSAYNAAMLNIQNQAQNRLAGLQGAQQGLGTALNAGQLGLAGTAQGIQGAQTGITGLNAANQAYQTGIQGAGMGLQGVDRQLAGTAQRMQGAQVGLQGVQGTQAGYGLANTAGQNLANIGTANLGTQQSIINAQNQMGQQQQQYNQNIINQQIQDYANTQQYPMQQLAMYNALLRGYSTPTSAQTTYQSAPSAISQFGGLAATGLGAYMASKKEGGVIDDPKKYAGGGLVDLAIANAMGEA